MKMSESQKAAMLTIEETGERPWRAMAGPGPWDSEPDKRQWLDESTGLPCLIVRSRHSGAWCGYVGVPSTHALYEVDYNEADHGFGVHGGLTYADHCAGRVCHVVEEGEDDAVWWLGFDCAHAYDLTPGGLALGGYEVYRDVAYVTAEVEQLAAQLAAM